MEEKEFEEVIVFMMWNSIEGLESEGCIRDSWFIVFVNLELLRKRKIDYLIIRVFCDNYSIMISYIIMGWVYLYY